MARNGKIAHLPRHIRNELNQRLDDAQPGAQILEWLNALEEVQFTLDHYFDGLPINEPNLTAWRQGGFQDWKRHQQSCEWVRCISQEADQVAEEAGLMPLSDRLSSIAGLALGKLLRNLDSASPPDPASQREFHALLKDLTQLRREDREAARLRMQLERYTEEKDRQLRASLAAPAYSTATRRPA